MLPDNHNFAVKHVPSTNAVGMLAVTSGPSEKCEHYYVGDCRDAGCQTQEPPSLCVKEASCQTHDSMAPHDDAVGASRKMGSIGTATAAPVSIEEWLWNVHTVLNAHARSTVPLSCLSDTYSKFWRHAFEIEKFLVVGNGPGAMAATLRRIPHVVTVFREGDAVMLKAALPQGTTRKQLAQVDADYRRQLQQRHTAASAVAAASKLEPKRDSPWPQPAATELHSRGDHDNCVLLKLPQHQQQTTDFEIKAAAALREKPQAHCADTGPAPVSSHCSIQAEIAQNSVDASVYGIRPGGAAPTHRGWDCPAVPPSIRRPWEVFAEDLEDQLADGSDDPRVQDLSAKVKDLGALAVLSKLPADEQRSWMDVSLMELGAYECWRQNPSNKWLVPRSNNDLGWSIAAVHAAWDAIGADQKSDFVPDDARAFLSKTYGWQNEGGTHSFTLQPLSADGANT